MASSLPPAGNENMKNSTDEIDLAPTRVSPPKISEAKAEKISIIWDIFAAVSMLTFIADIASDVVVAISYYRDGFYSWFGLTLALVLLSSIVTQLISFNWYHQDGQSRSPLVYAWHILHLAPVVRYVGLIKSGCWTRKTASAYDYQQYMAKWRDISMLRLFEAFLESAPQLVFQLYVMAYHRRFNIESDWFTVIAAGCSLVSLAWAIVAYTKALRDFMKDPASVSWIGVVLQILWRLFMVASRIVSLVLLAAEYGNWIFIAISLHWIIMTTWIVFQKTEFCSDSNGVKHPIHEFLFSVVIGFIYIFSFFNMKDGITRVRLISYYCIILVENTVCVVLWYPARHYYGNLEYPMLVVVWGGFLLGSLCMICYYNFYHPSFAVKGICTRKKIHGDDKSVVASITWCCCCTIHTKQDQPTTLHETQYCRRSFMFEQPEDASGDMDLEILPSTPSCLVGRANSPQVNGQVDPTSPEPHLSTLV